METNSKCPCCDFALPTKGEVRPMHLLVSPQRFVKRNETFVHIQSKSEEFKCFHRICQCGLNIAVKPIEDGFSYHFKCRACDCFTKHVSKAGWCISCILERSCGINDARSMMYSLKESDRTMGISRSDFLDGFLKGVLLGIEGLVVPDVEIRSQV